MSDERWFYRDEVEWAALVERLKRTPCPHCRAVGALNRHGSLHGYDDGSPRRKALRARRVFCSNRHRRPGCGRTVSVWVATRIRRSGLTTGTLWAFLRRAAHSGLAPAIRVAAEPRSPRSWRRIWRRFGLAQSRIRTALLSRGPPVADPTSLKRSPISSPRSPTPRARSPPSSQRPDPSFCDGRPYVASAPTFAEFLAYRSTSSPAGCLFGELPS